MVDINLVNNPKYTKQEAAFLKAAYIFECARRARRNAGQTLFTRTAVAASKSGSSHKRLDDIHNIAKNFSTMWSLKEVNDYLKYGY